MTELKTCPFCGGANLWAERPDNTVFTIQCSCGARGPLVCNPDQENELDGDEGKAVAITAWNTRDTRKE